MLRRDSSSLIPRDNVRFLGELLSTVTESIFYVLDLLLACVGATSNPLGEMFVSYAAAATPRLQLRKAPGSKLVLPPVYAQRNVETFYDDCETREVSFYL